MKQALKIGFASALALLAAISNANAFAHASAFVEWSVQSADADVSANLLGVKYHLLSNTNTGQAGGVYNFYFDDSYVSTDGNATASSGVFACDTIIKNWLRIQNSSTSATETLVLDVTTLAEVQTGRNNYIGTSLAGGYAFMYSSSHGILQESRSNGYTGKHGWLYSQDVLYGNDVVDSGNGEGSAYLYHRWYFKLDPGEGDYLLFSSFQHVSATSGTPSPAALATFVVGALATRRRRKPVS